MKKFLLFFVATVLFCEFHANASDKRRVEKRLQALLNQLKVTPCQMPAPVQSQSNPERRLAALLGHLNLASVQNQAKK